MLSSFRPPLSLTIVVIGALCALIALGMWQIQRLSWKTHLLTTIQERVKASPVDLSEALKLGTEADYRRGYVKGHFLHAEEFYLTARSLQGRVGHFVITPLRQEDGSLILVNRGWIPPHAKDPASRSSGQIQGPVEIHGIFRLPSAPQGLARWVGVHNNPDANRWYWVDISAMIASQPSLSSETAHPLVLDADAAPVTGNLPVGGQTRLTAVNDHLQYALTWFGLAIGLSIIYILYGLRCGKESRS